jgi:hypothetical protein
MGAILVNSRIGDGERRSRLYRGQLFVYAASPAIQELCDFAREMIEQAFPGGDPQLAQYTMPVEEFVRIFAPLKPAFIHHARTKGLIRQILSEFDCDLEKTYLDVPRLRAVTSSGYLTSGVGYAHHPHRDTWYSAPMCQTNWWLPIYNFEPESGMAFHPRYWNQPVTNGSSEFNYYDWNNNGRKNAAQFVTSDERKQPKAQEEMELEPSVTIVPEPGGVILFSAAQMHSTVPNTSGRTRFSIDFRTLHYDDVVNRTGAPNIDSRCTGTSLRDFMRGTDLSRLPEELVAPYDSGLITSGDVLVYQPIQ